MDYEAVAKEAYKAYGETTDFKNYQGLPMPTWEELSETIRKAWVNAARRSIEQAAKAVTLDERETAQVKHALHYAQMFPNAGIVGHGSFILIAKLARALRLEL